MNQYKRLAAQLSRLKNILTDARAILEWHKLRVFESSTGSSLKVFFQDDSFEQLIDKQAAFMLLFVETNTLLQDKTLKLSQDKKVKFQKELSKLLLQFQYLGSDVRIY